SNAWAVSGAHTSDGSPIVANDPHLSYGIPSTWHLVHLKAPGLNVIGAALPGVPCVITGHNEKIAWGVTNTQVDATDLYSEQLNRQTGRYLFKGNVEQALLDREIIGVRGQKPVALNIWVTRHGPILVEQSGKSYALRWTAAGGFVLPFFDLDRAQNWDQFRSALRDFWGPGQNFIYADRAGNIGYQATGKIPIRRGFSSDVPLDGSSGNFEWNGFIPFDEMPSIYDPPSGIVATANQSPFPPNYPYEVDGTFSDPYRITQIQTRLRAPAKLSVSDMLAVQKDVYSSYDLFLARQVVAAFDAKHDNADVLVREAVDALRSWNGQMDKDQAAPLITESLNGLLGRSLVFGLLRPPAQSAADRGLGSKPQAAQEKTGGRPKTNVNYEIKARPDMPISILPRPFIIEKLLRSRPAGWVSKNDWNAWLLTNLSGALQLDRAKQGSPVSHWKWGRSLEWKLNHPVGQQLPLVNAYFDIGPIPMSGSGTTVKQTTATLGPSERMVADLGNWDASVQNLTVGESGHVASRHYRDQWSQYYIGKSFPMEFEKVDAGDILRILPIK
ncbi:MAG TPA: penicillin acylase family protein, partial [Bryobacteraceae bacterium]|nr:penicillin acylase family protein [Bryobacteraceae bacterium]